MMITTLFVCLCLVVSYSQAEIVGHPQPIVVDVLHLESFKFQCSAPNATNFLWVLKSSDSPPKYLTLDDSNVSQDERGGIYFSFVTYKDQRHPLWYYVCFAGNATVQDVVVMLGINVKTNEGKKLPSRIPAREMYSNNGTHVVAEGSSIILYCIFSGYPEYTITPIWSREKKLLRLNRIYYGPYHSKAIKINNLTTSDADEYTCTIPGQNMEKKFKIVVN